MGCEPNPTCFGHIWHFSWCLFDVFWSKIAILTPNRLCKKKGQKQPKNTIKMVKKGPFRPKTSQKIVFGAVPDLRLQKNCLYHEKDKKELLGGGGGFEIDPCETM